MALEPYEVELERVQLSDGTYAARGTRVRATLETVARLRSRDLDATAKRDRAGGIVEWLVADRDGTWTSVGVCSPDGRAFALSPSDLEAALS